MSETYGPPNVGGKLLRTSSIENLQSLLNIIESDISGNENAIVAISNEPIMPSGIFSVGTIQSINENANAYTDQLIGNTDLTQVTTNMNAITTLNTTGAIGSVDESVATSLDPGMLLLPIADLEPVVNGNGDAITEISNPNPSTWGPTSVHKQITDLRDGVADIYDTVVEVADGTLENDGELGALTSSVAANKSSIEGLLQDQVTVQTDRETLQNSVLFPDMLTDNQTATDAAIAANVPVLDAAYFQKANLLSELREEITTSYPLFGNFTMVSMATAFIETEMIMTHHNYDAQHSGTQPYIVLTEDEGGMSMYQYEFTSITLIDLLANRDYRFTFDNIGPTINGLTIITLSLPILMPIGYVSDSLKQQTARTNLGIVGSVGLDDLVGTMTDTYRMHDIVVANGVIAVPTTKTKMKWIRINYPGGLYDTVKLVDGPFSGEFKVFDQVEGDLDGQTVEVRYVEEGVAVLPASPSVMPPPFTPSFMPPPFTL